MMIMKTAPKRRRLLRAALVVSLVVSLLFVATSAAEARHLLEGEDRTGTTYDTGASVSPGAVEPGGEVTISCCRSRIGGHRTAEFDVANIPEGWRVVGPVDVGYDTGISGGGAGDFVEVWGPSEVTFRVPEDAVPGTYELSVIAQAEGDATVAQDTVEVTVEGSAGAETDVDAELPEDVTTLDEFFGETDIKPEEGAGPDFGDARDPPYPTKEESDGARHADISRAWLGEGVDAEEDADVPFDEFDDGLVSIGKKLRVNVTNDDHDGTLYLNALLDMNESGSWDPPEEWIVENEPVTVPPGESKVVAVDADIPPMLAGTLDLEDTPPLRITLSGEKVSSYDGTGEFDIGETEDYLPPETRSDPEVECSAVGYHGGLTGLGAWAAGGGAGVVFDFSATGANVTAIRTSTSSWAPMGSFAMLGPLVAPKPEHETWAGNIDPAFRTFYYRTAEGRVLKDSCGAFVRHPFPEPTIVTDEDEPRDERPEGEEGGIETRSSLQPAWYYAGGQTIGQEYNPAMEDDADLPGWVEGLVDYTRMAASVKTRRGRVRVGAELDDQHKVVGMEPISESQMRSFDPQATVETSGRTVESILRSPDRVAAVRSAIEHGEINVETKSTLRGIQYGATTAVSRIGTKVRGSKYDCGPNEVRQIEYAGEQATLQRSEMGYRMVSSEDGRGTPILARVAQQDPAAAEMSMSNSDRYSVVIDDNGAPQGFTTRGTQRLIEKGGTREFSRRSAGVYASRPDEDHEPLPPPKNPWGIG